MTDYRIASEREQRESGHFANYMDLVIMYHALGKPFELLQKFPNYHTKLGLTTPYICDAIQDVQEGIWKVAESQGKVGVEGLVHLAGLLYGKDTVSSRHALYWMEHALLARNIINTSPGYGRRRKESGEDIEGGKIAYVQIARMQQRKVA